MSDQAYKDYVFDFEKLEVYQLALRFAGKIIEVSKKLPSDLRFTIGGNFIRAAMSIAHNLAEGSGQRSSSDKKRFYGYSLHSIRECIPAITVLYHQKQISEEIKDSLRADCIQMGRMVFGMIKKA